MVGLSGNPNTIYVPESISDPEKFALMSTRPMKPSLAELMLMGSLVEPYGSRQAQQGPETSISKPCGLTGDKWANRKSRSKIAKQSKKRNRK